MNRQRILQTAGLIVIAFAAQMTRPSAANSQGNACTFCTNGCPSDPVAYCLANHFGCGLFQGSCGAEECPILPGPGFATHKLICGGAT